MKYENIFKKGAYIFFMLFFIWGCFAFPDYGISIDEGVSRMQNGEVNYNFIKTGVAGDLLSTNEKYHGPAYELFLFTVEKIFNVTEYRDIYLLRHGLTFLTFFISVVFFYFIGLKVFKSHVAALFGCIILVISPRIFAESFYNSKDLPMLSFCIIASYTMFLFLERQTIWMALIHAACCAFVIDIRLTGLLLPFITVYMFVFQSKKQILPVFLFLFYTIIFIIAFWPVLWLDPISHFISAFKQMSNYQGGEVFYMGNYVSTLNLPWHYLPVWIMITTPVFYILLFITGMFFFIKNSFIDFFSTLPIQSFLIMFSAPILVVIFLNSTVYDAWRHVYFIYPYFLLIAVYGSIQIVRVLKNNKSILIISSISAFSILSVLFYMVKNHPFQNVYFNSLAGKNLRQNFELDYWGLSYRQGLEYILATDKSEKIYIEADPVFQFCQMNALIIRPEDRKRIVFTYDRSSADYFLSNFRWHPGDFNFGKSVYQINVGDEKIMEVLKLK